MTEMWEHEGGACPAPHLHKPPYCHTEGMAGEAMDAVDQALEDAGRKLEGLPPRVSIGCPICGSYGHTEDRHAAVTSEVDVAQGPGEAAGDQQDVTEPDAGSGQDA